MEAQSANAVLLVRPAAFGFNAEGARSNAFSTAPSDPGCSSRAIAEFERLERRLSDAGVEVLVLADTADPWKPDAVFPNNWMSTHADGTIAIYPMTTAPRRLERRSDDVRELVESSGFVVNRMADLTGHEAAGRFLEGTGSLVLDRPRRRAFASRSVRTDPAVVAEFDRMLGYSTFLFDAFDPHGRPIYHTNVLMSLGTRFAAICMEAVVPEQRARLTEEIEASGRTVIDLSFEQMSCFGCNILELRNGSGEPLVALSERALRNLRKDQLRALGDLGGQLIDAAIPTIESVGGGSVRCMIAEIHLPRR